MNSISEAKKAKAGGLLCPICQIGLVMSERQNIEIDYCPTCRGIWLDRGELDKIIERSRAEQVPSPPREVPADGRGYRDGHRNISDHGRGHRRKSWMQELFD